MQEYKTKNKIRYYKLVDRKQQTIRKIQMGGLVKKAGLDYLFDESPETLFGALVSLKHMIENDKLDISTFSAIGLQNWKKDSEES